MATETQTKVDDASKEAASQEKDPNQVVLLGSISYYYIIYL